LRLVTGPPRDGLREEARNLLERRVPPRQQTDHPMLKTLFSRPPSEGADYYSPVIVGPETLLRHATRPDGIQGVLNVLPRLEPDDYTRYLDAYCTEGVARFGDGWYYADICTVLLSATRLIGPATYLEIGVRRGRS